MKIIDLFEAYGNWFSPADLEGTKAKKIQSLISSRLGGKARIFYSPVAGDFKDGDPWWTILLLPEGYLNKITRSLNDLAKQNNINMHMTTHKDELESTAFGKELYNQAMHFMDYAGLKEKQPNIVPLMVYISSEEKEAPVTNKYYHVTFNPDVLKHGLHPKGTVKYKGRVYLWDDLDIAKSFARTSHHQSSTAWILEVVPQSKVYVDPEYQEGLAFYTYDEIPANKIKLLLTYDSRTNQFKTP